MNEPKYPKPLGVLLALNLCALLTLLILTMDDIWNGVRSVMGMQSIVMALGLALIGLPKGKGQTARDARHPGHGHRRPGDHFPVRHSFR